MVKFLCCGLDSKGNTLISKETQRLETENQRLKAQLDREIHINRKMKRALEKYAFGNTKMEIPNWIGDSLQPRNELDIFTPISLINKPEFDGVKEIEIPYANDTSLAQQTLKKWEDK